LTWHPPACTVFVLPALSSSSIPGCIIIGVGLKVKAYDRFDPASGRRYIPSGEEHPMKGLIKNLFRNHGSAAARDDALKFTVKCRNCGDQVHVRVDRNEDLLADYDSDEGGFILTKEVQDGTCFRIMRLTARFSQDRHLLSQEVEGGEIIETKE
jgi:hypothetical protein